MMKVNRRPRPAAEQRAMFAVWLAGTLLGIAFWVAVIYIVAHFIAKWW